ncbi:MAG: redoxin domain-containing protein [Actinobacteria bacterium]|nr:redoxin domain-containing protein [Actinomycetota bacterium]
MRWCAAGIVALAIAAGAVLGSQLGKDPSLVDSPLIGRPAPAETLPYLEQPATLPLRSLRGQVVVVNFWASWCVACREEQPTLAAAATAYPAKGVVFVGIDYQDQHGAAVAFLNELGRGAGYRYVTDPDSRAAIDFGVFGVPETFFLDRAGTIVAKITGPTTAQLLGDTINTILAGQTPRSRVGGPVQPAPTGPP